MVSDAGPGVFSLSLQDFSFYPRNRCLCYLWLIQLITLLGREQGVLALSQVWGAGHTTIKTLYLSCQGSVRYSTALQEAHQAEESLNLVTNKI